MMVSADGVNSCVHGCGYVREIGQDNYARFTEWYEKQQEEAVDRILENVRNDVYCLYSERLCLIE